MTIFRQEAEASSICHSNIVMVDRSVSAHWVLRVNNGIDRREASFKCDRIIE